jgi:hypothetical protein
VVKAQETALSRIGVAQSEVRRAQRRGADTRTSEAHLGHAEDVLASAREELADTGDPATGDESGPGWKERLASLPWKRIAALAVTAFVLAIAALTAFELASGRSVSSYTGNDDQGTTILGGRSDSGDQQRDREETPQQEPSDGATPTEEPTEEPTEAPIPTDGATPAPSPTPAEPTTPPTPTAPASPAPTE